VRQNSSVRKKRHTDIMMVSFFFFFFLKGSTALVGPRLFAVS
jgi:hypothetical protein